MVDPLRNLMIWRDRNANKQMRKGRKATKRKYLPADSFNKEEKTWLVYSARPEMTFNIPTI